MLNDALSQHVTSLCGHELTLPFTLLFFLQTHHANKMKNVVYCFNFLYPLYQMVAFLDHSSTHDTAGKDALTEKSLPLKWGYGEATVPRDSLLEADCVGDPATKVCFLSFPICCV